MANVNAFTVAPSGPATSTWTPQQAQRTSILDTTNPLFPRTIILDNSGLLCQRVGVEPTQLPVALFLAAVAASNPAMTWAPICSTQPVNMTLLAGNAAVFASVFTAETAITYQWQKSLNAGTTWTNLTNAGVYSTVTTNTLNISSVTGLNGTYFRCLATNATGSTPTNTVLLSVQSDPYITVQPVSQSVTHPSGVSFTLAVIGNTSLTYQWQLYSGSTWNNVANGGVYSGATTNTLVISISTGLNGNQYRCMVTDAAGTATSSAALLTVA